jgi:hypothetical protein
VAAVLTLKALRFRAGPRPGDVPVDLEPPTVIVLVGPNGSGKSRTLGEIEEWARGNEQQRPLVDDIDVAWPSYEEARELLRPCELPSDHPNVVSNTPVAGYTRVQAPGLLGEHLVDVSYGELKQALASEHARKAYAQHLRRVLLSIFTARLTGRERHALANDQQLGDLARPQTHLAVLFADDDLRRRVRGRIYEAFGTYFALDRRKRYSRSRSTSETDCPTDPSTPPTQIAGRSPSSKRR